MLFPSVRDKEWSRQHSSGAGVATETHPLGKRERTLSPPNQHTCVAFKAPVLCGVLCVVCCLKQGTLECGSEATMDGYLSLEGIDRDLDFTLLLLLG